MILGGFLGVLCILWYFWGIWWFSGCFWAVGFWGFGFVFLILVVGCGHIGFLWVYEIGLVHGGIDAVFSCVYDLRVWFGLGFDLIELRGV